MKRRALLQAGALAALSAWAHADDMMRLPARISRKATVSLMLAAFARPGLVVAVGERGLILLSTDEGRTWAQGASPTSVTLTGVYFVDDKRGWAVGHNGVVVGTLDGGKTWKMQFDGDRANSLAVASASLKLADLEDMVKAEAKVQRAPSAELIKQIAQAKDTLADARAGERFGPTRPLMDLWFASPDVGFVVGSYGQIFETRDSGLTWRYLGDRLDNPDASHLNAIVPLGSGRMMVVGEAGRVWLSSADARQWTRADTDYKGPLYGGAQVPGEDGKEVLVVFGFAGKVFRSADAGRSWTEVATGRHKAIVAGVRRGNALDLVDVEGAVLESGDGGRTFKESLAPLPFQIRGATVTATGKLIRVGFGGVHMS